MHCWAVLGWYRFTYLNICKASWFSTKLSVTSPALTVQLSYRRYHPNHFRHDLLHLIIQGILGA